MRIVEQRSEVCFSGLAWCLNPEHPINCAKLGKFDCIRFYSFRGFSLSYSCDDVSQKCGLRISYDYYDDARLLCRANFEHSNAYQCRKRLNQWAKVSFVLNIALFFVVVHLDIYYLVRCEENFVVPASNRRLDFKFQANFFDAGSLRQFFENFRNQNVWIKNESGISIAAIQLA